ncbi:lysophospholipid acyltransferase family protein [Desulfocurvibacter africanus]|uniref:lysophospholipid acyltransferase family protein n=1 Tax=Desulfocurvibacter africanus TaxID=873 RepID=UPI000486A34F|nr:lysophospholipid acyltransferase family protein [Desulfocurvibacter africanus]
MPQAHQEKLLRLDVPIRGSIKKRLFHLVRPPLSRLLCLSKLNDIYSAVDKRDLPTFMTDSLRHMGVRINLSFEDASLIPTQGPVLVVANHPFGAIEGVVLGSVLRSARPDVKLMANYMLSVIPEMRELLIQVDPFGAGGSHKRNIGPLKESLRWLKSGGMLGVFPAGEVSSLNVRKRSVEDPQWSTTIARMARKAGVPVLPVYFDGCNSPLFQMLGLIHPRLRTAMLPRELLNRREGVIDVRIGSLIQPSKFESFDTDEQLVDFLRQRTYILKHRKPEVAPAARIARKAVVGEPIAPPVAPALIEAEIASLSKKSILWENNEYTLFLGRRSELPNTVLELGRLREETFREVGEGTGKASDLDQYDDYYWHLCLWHRQDREIAGSYRLGPTDEILARVGPSGLYTNTLFRYRREFLEQISPALELGRSFVRKKYQKSYLPLLTLWKGIGIFLGRNMQYRYLFGPVSISNSYAPFSKALMVKFLNTHARERVGGMVKAKLPPRLDAGPNWRELCRLCCNIEDLGDFISEIEKDRKGVPVLLRQYLKLGGKILAFNVDPEFAGALDGLILVDLLQTDPKTLGKHMGVEAATQFLALHKGQRTDKAS